MLSAPRRTTANHPTRLSPFVSSISSDAFVLERIAIDPHTSFGRPVVIGRGISTAAIADRIDAGESVAALAEEYELTTEEIQHAALYERAA